MPFVRVLVGAVLGWVIVCASVALGLLVAVRSPFPKGWWILHMPMLVTGSEILASLPCVVILGFLMSKLYRVRPVVSALARPIHERGHFAL